MKKLFPASKAGGTAAIICPGGGYVRLSTEREGLHYAQWLAGLGVTAYVLIAFYQALTRAKVPAELHVFEQGGHGAGMNEGLGTTSAWPKRAEEWRGMRALLNPPQAR